jgi:hypothetical protein
VASNVATLTVVRASTDPAVAATPGQPLRLLRLVTTSQHWGSCVPELNGRAASDRSGCEAAELVLVGSLDPAATGSVRIVAIGGYRRLAESARTIKATALVKHGHWRAQLLIPGRDYDPGDRWTIIVTYAGRMTRRPQTIRRTILLELERVGTTEPGSR